MTDIQCGGCGEKIIIEGGQLYHKVKKCPNWYRSVADTTERVNLSFNLSQAAERQKETIDRLLQDMRWKDRKFNEMAGQILQLEEENTQLRTQLRKTIPPA